MKTLKVIGLAILAVITFAVVGSATAPEFWGEHKTEGVVYALDLAGSAPTATQMSNNNIRVGSMIVDTSDGSTYVVTAPASGTSLKISADTTIDILDGQVVNADVSAGAAIAPSKLATTGLGTGTAGSTVAEAGDGICITTITISTNVTATEGTDEGESAKIFDCDVGQFTLLAAIANLSVTNSAGATNTIVVSFGTAAAGDDSALTSTEANIIPSTTIYASNSLNNAFDAVLAAPAAFDGTATAIDIYYNMAIDDDNMDADVTNTVTGTLILITTEPTTNQ